MADDGAVAVAEAPAVDAGGAAESFVDEPASAVSTEPAAAKPNVDDKTDGRRQPDSVRKRVAELRRQADAAVDPNEKAALLADAKAINNGMGKVAAYEQHFPTVREAREVKALVESFGGREGLTQVQQTLSNVQQIDQQLEAGDPAVSGRMWDEAPEGMTKLAPVIFSELEKRNPQEYEKAVTPHAIKYFENGGFLNAISELYRGLQDGNAPALLETVKRMEKWFLSRKEAQRTEQPTDPRVEQLQRELDEGKSKESAQATDRAYSDVVAHAAPTIDKYLKPIVAKLGLSQAQYNALREDTWKHLEDTRNADATYKTIANAKYRQGMDAAVAYIKGETESRAESAARARANFWYGHQLKNGAVTKPNPTATPIAPGITRGKEPSAAEIDYSPKGIALAKKQGFKDLGDMILAGKAPLKAGGIRQWR